MPHNSKMPGNHHGAFASGQFSNDAVRIRFNDGAVRDLRTSQLEDNAGKRHHRMAERREIDERDIDRLLAALTDRQIANLYGMTELEVYHLRLFRQPKPPGSPPIACITFPTCCAHYPGGSSGCSCRLLPRSRGLPQMAGGSASAL